MANMLIMSMWDKMPLTSRRMRRTFKGRWFSLSRSWVALFFALLGSSLIFLPSCRRSTNLPVGTAAEGGPTRLWEFQSGARVLTGSALDVDGIVYAASDQGLLAISPQGTLLWKYSINAMHAPPVVRSDRVIYVTGGYGMLQSVTPDGKQAWDSTRGMIGFEGSPAIDETGAAYLANTVSDLWAFQPVTQPSLLWNLNTERLGGPGLPGDASTTMHSNASPVIGVDGDLYIPRQRMLHRFTTQGIGKWSIVLGTGILGPAALGADGTVYVGDQRARKLFAVSADGVLKWSLEAWVISSAVVDAQDTIYFCSSTGITAVTPDGKIRWQLQTPDRPYSSPALAEDGTLYFGMYPNKLMAVKNDGKVKWVWTSTGMPTWSPVIGPEGTIYVTTDRGAVIALKDSGSPLMKSAWPRYQHDAQNTGHR